MSRHHISTRHMKTVRRHFREECKAKDEPCWLCGQRTIDYETQGEPDSFSLDHFYPVSTHPEFITDPANFRASHSLCNTKRGNAAPTAGLGTTSEDWGI